MLVLIPILSKLFGLKIDTFKTTIEIVVIMYVILNFININKRTIYSQYGFFGNLYHYIKLEFYLEVFFTICFFES